MPERMQLCDVQVNPVPERSTGLEDKADWFYKQAFVQLTISNQNAEGQKNQYHSGQQRKPPSTINKIKQALDFMRNRQLEVPFIAFHCKEYVQPELAINDVWKVYKWDAK